MKKLKKLKKVKIIAEIGPNHNGKLDIAKKMLTQLSKTDIDIVKFQLGNPDNIFSKDAILANYQKNSNYKNPILLSKKNQLSPNSHIKLKKLCKKLNLTYACTAFDLKSLIFLDKKLKIPFFKIASGEIHSLDMLEYISKSKKPVILSTGMSNISDIKMSLKVLQKNNKKNITLLHCVSAYPTKLKDMNMKRIDLLKKKFKLDVGLSDHSLSFAPAILAIVNGATVIEKHVTLSKKFKGPDHRASLEIPDFIDFVNIIRETEILNRSKLKKINLSENNVKKVSRKSIVSFKFIPKGKKIEKNDLCFKRPGYGISPLKIEKVIGKRALKNILSNKIILKKNLS